ncbi:MULTISPECIES: 2-oxo-4-hydroxy-4-carboxy-5-ureidoimidazoline decarboxylase [Acetobacter]|uniref:2-oxo-4-hydroxy-4-carboxy-5-ureidoimidazoline decarboxylase n=2 Tax=Acetobacter TaxID=434 RepID=A0A5B9GHW1_9PROT|nr:MULTISPECIES: 2-oxo-4-hydroxy-4-carboxy-5-ureidoimidazoline decarboxylase [Acetobacter]AKR49281.1 OHCU decarboxylase [Acetobacter pasteurianus]ARW48895.1 2-oxo-4-hydroxy-4-carboxy-5-ureidoimidazoline decarboxylase [Acetobacter pasteurianus subsp. pasteurianus]MCP1201149.1 2-oxo-4-hydroxy-4-carboxy-5-ureidoimidazoline decarboxylase [Acetobacter oryzoeni]QEE85317.1 2-oxo-4-hydroxy-4-carboxy-5-ureidoimidazoline decarboxylase [Acetobacter oryzoeni]
MIPLQDVNTLSPQQFVEAFGGIYEHSPWVAEAAAKQRPFASMQQMKHAFSQAVQQAPESQKLALVRAHPELGHRMGIDPDLSAESTQEQGSAGLDKLSPAEYRQLRDLNDAYQKKFGMPFVICVRQATKAVILEAMEQRLTSSFTEELAEALKQIDAIAALRLQDKVQA